MCTHFLLKCLGNDACVNCLGSFGWALCMLKLLSSPEFCLPFKEVEIRVIEGTTQVPVHLREQAYLNASYTNSYLIVRIFFKPLPLTTRFTLLGGRYPSNMSLLLCNSERSHSWSPWAKQAYDEGCSCAVTSNFLTAPCLWVSGFLSVLCKQGSDPMVWKGNSNSLNVLLETNTIEYPNYFGNSSQWKTTVKYTKQIKLGAEKFWAIRPWSLSNDRALESAIHVWIRQSSPKTERARATTGSKPWPLPTKPAESLMWNR